MGKVILGNNIDLIKAMQEAGILPDNCRRVVIDIPYDDLVEVYYECLGDTRLLDVGMPKHLGAMVREVEAQKVIDKNLEEAQKQEDEING